MARASHADPLLVAVGSDGDRDRARGESIREDVQRRDGGRQRADMEVRGVAKEALLDHGSGAGRDRVTGATRIDRDAEWSLLTIGEGEGKLQVPGNHCRALLDARLCNGLVDL